MNIVSTIEARMTSSRLPGKVLLPADGKPMLAHLVSRLRQVPSINNIILATTTNQADDPLQAFSRQVGILCHRGSEDDVMGRVIGAAEQAKADIIVEITGDCPIIDPRLVEQAIRIFTNNKCEYAGNAHVRSYPDGMDVQVFWLETLKRSSSMTSAPLDREHVTLHIRQHPELFSHLHIVAPPDEHWPDLGLTLDEESDYKVLKHLIEHFGPDNPHFSCREVVSYLRKRPEIASINRQVTRKGDT